MLHGPTAATWISQLNCWQLHIRLSGPGRLLGYDGGFLRGSHHHPGKVLLPCSVLLCLETHCPCLHSSLLSLSCLHSWVQCQWAGTGLSTSIAHTSCKRIFQHSCDTAMSEEENLRTVLPEGKLKCENVRKPNSPLEIHKLKSEAKQSSVHYQWPKQFLAKNKRQGLLPNSGRLLLWQKYLIHNSFLQCSGLLSPARLWALSNIHLLFTK